MSDVTNEYTLYEIVELDDGEVGLCRAGDDKTEDEPLVVIKFSEESRYFLGETTTSIAKAMIEAGLEAVQTIQEESAEDNDLQEDDTEEAMASHLVH